MAKSNGSIKDIADGRSDMFRLDPRKIKVKANWNNRDFANPENLEHVAMLKASIAIVGVKEPLTVYMDGGEVYLSDGECRLRATMEAIAAGTDIKTVPVKIEDRYSDEAEKIFSQILRNSGKPFTPLEQAKTFKKLLDLGWMAKDIAEKSGITAGRVSQVLELLTMPAPIKAMVIAGQVSANMAMTAVREHNPAAAVQVLKDAVHEAQQQGRTKAKPSDQQGTPSAERKGIETMVKDALEFSDIDNNNDDFVIIKMPTEHWEKLRKRLSL